MTASWRCVGNGGSAPPTSAGRNRDRLARRLVGRGGGNLAAARPGDGGPKIGVAVRSTGHGDAKRGTGGPHIGVAKSRSDQPAGRDPYRCPVRKNGGFGQQPPGGPAFLGPAWANPG